MSAIRVTGGSNVRTATPISFPGKEDPVTGEVTFTVPRRAAPFIIAELPPVNPTEAAIPEAPAADVAAAGGYTLSDLAAGAGAPTVGAPASKDSLKTLDTSTGLTDTTPKTPDNTYLYIGIGIAAVGGLYFYSQTDAGKAALKRRP